MGIRFLCGAAAHELGLSSTSAERSQIPRALKHFFSALHAKNDFAQPSLDVVDNLSLFSNFQRFPGDQSSELVEWQSLSGLVGAISDLDALQQFLNQIDSPSFAMWCGTHQSEARTALLELQAEVNKTLTALRSESTSVISVIGASHFCVDRERLNIQQAGLLGLRVDQVILVSDSLVNSRKQEAWIKKLRRAGAGSVVVIHAPELGKYSKKIDKRTRRGKCLVPGDVTDAGDGNYVYSLIMKRAKRMPLDVGVLGNVLIIDLQGVRRSIELPAACSRMTAERVHLDGQGISIHLSAKRNLWPTM